MQTNQVFTAPYKSWDAMKLKFVNSVCKFLLVSEVGIIHMTPRVMVLETGETTNNRHLTLVAKNQYSSNNTGRT